MTAFPELSEEVVARLDVAGPRYTSYPTVPEWSDDFAPERFDAALEAAAAHSELPLGLYVHIPFCRERCTFCGCNVVIAKDQGRADKYLDHLMIEMDLAVSHLGSRKKLSQIHWGGGTPTFLTESQLERLWRGITDRFELVENAEVSIEVDPVVTSLEKITLLHQLGFNRLSMGVQDFDEHVQEAVNRKQSVEVTQGLTEHARAVGFQSVNYDLIQGLPYQTQESWAETLNTIIGIRPDRLAVYSFAFVPSVKPHQKRLPILAIPTGSTKLALFRDAYNRFVEAGYRPIGMDHFALPEDELSVAQQERRLWRNFMGYTVHAAPDTVAFGVTAISDIQGTFSQAHPQMNKYYRSIEERHAPVSRGLVLSEDDKKRRDVITQLMCNFWVDLGEEGASYFAEELEALAPHEADGLVRRHGTEIEITPLGRVFVRNVAMVFDAYLKSPGAHRAFSRTV